MLSEERNSTSDVEERAEEIRRVLEEVIKRRRDGEQLPDEHVVSAHPDLVPELQEQLGHLAKVQLACHRAEEMGTMGTVALTVGQLGSSNEVVGTSDTTRVATLEAGKQIGQYIVERPLGHGGMGEVWLAHDRILGRNVAIKIIPYGRADASAAARFLQEARAAATLNHPNVVTVYHVLEESNELRIVMELLEGSLADEVKLNGAMPWREATQAARDAAAGLASAHAAGIIHRDIKPSNLMRSARSTVKLVDFGLARVELSSECTRAGVGTPAFMSPEQCRGDRIDVRSDIYSLTCTYYMLLTRRHPFEADSAAAMMYRHCHEPFPDARNYAPDLPDSVCRILLKGSEKDPESRFPSAAAMLEALDAVLDAPDQSHTFGEAALAPITAEEAALPPLSPASLRGGAARPRSNEASADQALQKTVMTQPAPDAAGLTPLIGRELQLATIVDRWQTVKQGGGQVLLVTGEAGIGKSRLVRAFQKRIEAEDHIWRQCCGSPFAQNSAFRPIIELLEKALQFGPADSPEAKLAKLDTFVATHELPAVPAVPLLAHLLSVPYEGRYTPLGLSAQGQKRKTTELLLYLLPQLARNTPVVFVVEDLHWLDSSTIELIGLLIDQIPTTAVLVLLTARPEFQPPWPFRSHLLRLTLDRLSSEHAAQIVESSPAGRALAATLQRLVVQKADGVPLFVEELTKAVSESALPDKSRPGGEFALTIPETLNETLMARLDRLATIKEVVEVAAIIGREFAYQLLMAVAPVNERILQKEITKLLDAGLLYQRGLVPQAVYVFKHALIHEAVYQSSPKRRRALYHGRIAELLTKQFPDIAAGQPELIARHFTEAGMLEQAVTWWHLAGKHAIERSANIEAISHLRTGLELVAKLPDQPQRHQLELLCQSTIGVPLIATQGYAAAGVENAYARTIELCRMLGLEREHHVSSHGLFQVYLGRAEYGKAFEIATQIVDAAESSGDSGLQLLAHAAMGVCRFYTGDLASCRDHAQHAVVLHRSGHGHEVFASAQDMSIAAECWLAWTAALMGRPDQALKDVQGACCRADESKHPHTQALSRDILLLIHILRRDTVQCIAEADLLTALAREHQFLLWISAALICHGWALVETGNYRSGLEELGRGIEGWIATGEKAASSYCYTLYADAMRKATQLKMARHYIDLAWTFAQERHECFYEPEILRVRGEILLAENPAARDEAEDSFTRALCSARVRGAKLLELRAAISLGRLWQCAGRANDAYQSISEIYKSFSEGHGIPDLQEASALIAELRHGER